MKFLTNETSVCEWDSYLKKGKTFLTLHLIQLFHFFRTLRIVKLLKVVSQATPVPGLGKQPPKITDQSINAVN